jgi:hypothetical protein
VVVPYLTIFLGLYFAYLTFSVWAQLDSRYPVILALLVLVAAALAAAVREPVTANTFATYALFLLVGGVALMIVERARTRSLGTPPAKNSSGPSDGRS